MRDIRMKLHPALDVFLGTVLRKLPAAVVAVPCPEVIFPATLFTMIAHFP